MFHDDLLIAMLFDKQFPVFLYSKLTDIGWTDFENIRKHLDYQRVIGVARCTFFLIGPCVKVEYTLAIVHPSLSVFSAATSTTPTPTTTGGGGGPTIPCVDRYRECAAWAKAGKCSKYSDSMHANCKKSCTKCSKFSYNFLTSELNILVVIKVH